MLGFCCFFLFCCYLIMNLWLYLSTSFFYLVTGKVNVLILCIFNVLLYVKKLNENHMYIACYCECQVIFLKIKCHYWVNKYILQIPLLYTVWLEPKCLWGNVCVLTDSFDNPHCILLIFVVEFLADDLISWHISNCKLSKKKQFSWLTKLHMTHYG